MFRFNSLSHDRKEELLKLSTAEALVADIAAQPFNHRSFAIRTQSRLLLGLEIDRDIAECDILTRQELLFVMRSLRDAVFPEQSDDTMESR